MFWTKWVGGCKLALFGARKQLRRTETNNLIFAHYFQASFSLSLESVSHIARCPHLVKIAAYLDLGRVDVINKSKNIVDMLC